MLLKVTYTDINFIKKLKSELSSEVKLIYYSEELHKERKKAFSIKNEWGALASPFAIIYNDDKPIKAFYSEINECTIDNIINYLNNLINENTSN